MNKDTCNGTWCQPQLQSHIWTSRIVDNISALACSLQATHMPLGSLQIKINRVQSMWKVEWSIACSSFRVAYVALLWACLTPWTILIHWIRLRILFFQIVAIKSQRLSFQATESELGCKNIEAKVRILFILKGSHKPSHLWFLLIIEKSVFSTQSAMSFIIYHSEHRSPVNLNSNDIKLTTLYLKC